ncbi:hypothetical protein ACLEPN_21995 [Myxococcus sp. 1LA]
MAIDVNEVRTLGTKTAVPAGGAGAGFRVEPSPSPEFPKPTYPVTVRTIRADGVTGDEYVMVDGRGRFPAEGFIRLELMGVADTNWTVTVYTTPGDWDEMMSAVVLGPQLLDAGTFIGTGDGTVALRPALNVHGFKRLWLQVASSTIGTATGTPILRSLGGTASFALTVADYEGGALTIGTCAEVQVGAGLHDSTVGRSRTYGARLLRVHPMLSVTGTSSGYNAHWQLWAER